MWAEVLRNPCILRGPKTRGQNHKWLPHHCLLGAHKWGEVPRNYRILGGLKKKGDKCTSGCLTIAFSGAHKWGVVLCNPCILGGPRQGGRNHKWLPQTSLLKGQKWEEELYSHCIRS